MRLSRRTIAWCAILAGMVGLVGLVFLLLFFALESPALLEVGEGGLSARPVFGTLNDATYVFVALLMIPVVLGLRQLTRSRSARLSLAAAVAGVAGFGTMAVIQTLYVVRGITTGQQAAAMNLAIGLVGVWLLSTSCLGRGLPHQRVAWLGMVSGTAILLLPISYFGAGGSAVLENPGALPGNAAFVLGFAAAMLALNLGFPAWTILVGRGLLTLEA